MLKQMKMLCLMIASLLGIIIVVSGVLAWFRYLPRRDILALDARLSIVLLGLCLLAISFEHWYSIRRRRIVRIMFEDYVASGDESITNRLKKMDLSVIDHKDVKLWRKKTICPIDTDKAYRADSFYQTLKAVKEIA